MPSHSGSSLSPRRVRTGAGPEPATLKEVAHRAGVSLSTASLVLNERPGTRIAAETRRRIWQAARELRYRMERAHRRLRLRYLLADGNIPLTPYERLPVFAAAQDEADRRGAMLEVRFAGQEVDEQVRCIDSLAEGGVEGVLVAAALEPAAVDRLLELCIPTVMVGSVQVHPRISSVYSDSPQGTTLLMEHLQELGHRRIAFCGVNPDNFYEEQRFQLFHALSLRAEVSVPPEWVCWSHHDSQRLEQWVEQLVSLPRGQRPTAIFTDREPLADRLLRLLDRHGLRVPRDVSLVCYDERDPYLSEGRSITSIRRSGEAISRLAVGLLLEEMAHPDLPRVRMLLPGELVPGETSSAAPLETLVSRRSA